MKVYYSFCFFILFIAFISPSCNSKRKEEAGGASQKPGGNRPPSPRVDAFIVQTQTVSEALEVPGTLVTEDATDVHPEVSGRMVGL